jgi:hypothetical protein
VRIRAFRAWLRAVRVVVCRMRFRADAVFAILVRSLKLPRKGFIRTTPPSPEIHRKTIAPWEGLASNHPLDGCQGRENLLKVV